MTAEVAVLKTDEKAKAILKNVRAYAIEIPIAKNEEGEAKRPDDASLLEPFEELLRTRRIVEPPFDLFSLSVFPEHNSELGQGIETMVVNIDGFGWLLKLIPGLDEGTKGIAESP